MFLTLFILFNVLLKYVFELKIWLDYVWVRSLYIIKKKGKQKEYDISMGWYYCQDLYVKLCHVDLTLGSSNI